MDAICYCCKRDYMLENISNKNGVYKKLKHLDDVIFRVDLLGFGIRVFLNRIYIVRFLNKIRGLQSCIVLVLSCFYSRLTAYVVRSNLNDVPRLPSYGVYISQFGKFSKCCTSIFDFHSKNLQMTSKLLTQGNRYYKLRKTFRKFFRSCSELLSKFGEISFQEYVSDGISHPVFYSDLVYKLRTVKCEANFVSLGSKIVKRLRRRNYDTVIIERTMGLVMGPSTALYRSFLEHCNLTYKAVGAIWQTCPILLRGDSALILVPSAC